MDDEIEILEEVRSPNSEIFRKFWGAGEWDDESDFLCFKYKGYVCSLGRCLGEMSENCFSGFLCGYMTVPKTHRLYDGKDWGKQWLDLDVHGGITYCEMRGDDFVLGFDCAHHNDMIPGMKTFQEKHLERFMNLYKDLNYKPSKTVYRNLQYVINNCKHLVDQVIELDSKDER